MQKNRASFKPNIKGTVRKVTTTEGIRVLNPLMKILGKLNRNKLEKVSPEQCDFTARSSNVVHISRLRQMLGKSGARSRDVEMAFVVLAKAYNSFPWALLFEALGDEGESLIISNKII